MVDSSILIDIVTEREAWTVPSRRALEVLGRDRELVVNSIVFAEVSIPFDRVEDIDDRLPRDVFRREEVPWEAAFLAGKAFLQAAVFAALRCRIFSSARMPRCVATGC